MAKNIRNKVNFFYYSRPLLKVMGIFFETSRQPRSHYGSPLSKLFCIRKLPEHDSFYSMKSRYRSLANSKKPLIECSMLCKSRYCVYF